MGLSLCLMPTPEAGDGAPPPQHFGKVRTSLNKNQELLLKEKEVNSGGANTW